MKEYWVNVYSDSKGYDDIRYGTIKTKTREQSIKNSSKYTIYRIHVKMKEVKPKYDSFFKDNSKIIKELG